MLRDSLGQKIVFGNEGLMSGRLPKIAGLVAVALGVACSPALADKIKNPTAIFAGLDKITGRIVSFEVAVNETVQFGSLQLTPRVCYSRPETEAPRTTSFIEVEEVDAANQLSAVFNGWVFAASPGLSAIDHPVYDIWLTQCKGGTEIIKSDDDEPLQVVNVPAADAAAAEDAAAKKPKKRAARKQQPKQKFFPTTVDAGAPISLTPN
jgi:hypothetical protein